MPNPEQSCRSCRWWSDNPAKKTDYCMVARPFYDARTGPLLTNYNEGQTCPTWEARDDHA